MTTYSLDAIFARYDANDELVEAGMRTVSFVMAPGADTFTYTVLESYSGEGAEIEFTGLDIQTLYLDGVVVTNQVDAFLTSASFGNGDTTQYVALQEAGQFEEVFIVRLGGDPFPTVNSVAQFEAVGDSITSYAVVTTGPLAPDQPIQINSLPGVTSTQNDRIVGTVFNDELDGGIGNDTIFGLGGHDTLFGGDGNDTLRGGDGSDDLIGGDGTDYINPGSNFYGTDFIEAGRGNDTIDYSDNEYTGWQILSYRWGDFTSGITANFDLAQNTATVSKPGGQTDTIRNVTKATGGDGLRLEGTENSDTFNVRSAEDQYISNRGNQGNDIYNLTLDGGTITVDLRLGGQAISFDGQNDRIWNDGYGDTDILNITRVEGTDGVLQIWAGDGNDSLIGTDGRDRFVTERGNDTVDGGAGWDVIRYNRNDVGPVSVDLTEGKATGTWDGQSFTHTLSNLEEVVGSRYGDDTLIGDWRDNSLYDFDGNNLLEGRGGADDLFGGDGNDTLRGGSGDDYLSGDDGDDHLIGGTGYNILVGADGNDLIDASKADFVAGQDHTDFIAPGLGQDTIIGSQTAWDDGRGITLSYFDVSGVGGLTISAASGRVTSGTGAVDDTFTYANSFSGSQDADRIIGSAQDWERFQGNAGNDTINGREGIDQVSYVGAAVDGYPGGIVADMQTGRVTDPYGDTDRLFNIERIFGTDAADTMVAADAGGMTFYGMGGNDTLQSGDGNDVLRGGDGADKLIGGAGRDDLSGGDGTDTLIGGDGDDFIFGGDTEADLRDVVYAGEGNDSIDGGWGNDSLRGDGGNDTIAGGFGADTVLGGDGDDVMTGSAFSDRLSGGNGDDFINGGFGFDRVGGDAGADKFFHVGVKGHGSDWVRDYDAAEGDLLVSGIRGSTAADYRVNFAGSGAGDANVAEAFVRYIPTGQTLWVLVDGGAQTEINLQIGGVTYDLLA